jgi:hypothetical protein
MKLTGSQLLPYPEGNDPGDGALDLQLLAQAIDAKLVAEFASFRGVRNKWVFVQSRSSDQTGLVANSTTTNFGSGTSISFNNLIYTTSLTTTGSSVALATADPGYFRVGLYVVSNPSGTVTANTYRTARIVAVVGTGPPAFTSANENYYSTTYESSTGAEHQFIEAMVRIEAPAYSSFQFSLRHGNTGSNLTIKAGSLAWVYRVCDLEP